MRDEELWKAIRSIDLDGHDDGPSFARRIAEAARWPKQSGEKLAQEFRKLLYLMMTTQTPIAVPEPLVFAVATFPDRSVELPTSRLASEESGFILPGAVSDFRYWVLLQRIRRRYAAEFKADPPSDIWAGNAVDASVMNGAMISASLLLVLSGFGMLAYATATEDSRYFKAGAVLLTCGILVPALFVDWDKLIWKYVYKSGKKGGRGSNQNDPQD